MSTFEIDSASPRPKRAPTPMSDIDLALTAQLVVAWAGESGEEKRLGWWRSDLISEFGGEDLFQRLLPATWPWAVLQSARETARRRDAELRAQDHDPDRIVSLFHFGFEIDERIDERLQSLKRSGREPKEALPGLAIMSDRFRRDRFFEWVDGHGKVATTATPRGRRLEGQASQVSQVSQVSGSLDQLVRRLVAGLAPAADSYPLPHVRRAP